MAQKVLIQLVDDISGEEADETVTFGLDGYTYEIDLSAANSKKLYKAFTPYVENARKVKGGKAKRVGPAPKAVRDWARANGLEVNEKGRVAADIVKAYEAAQ